MFNLIPNEFEEVNEKRFKKQFGVDEIDDDKNKRESEKKCVRVRF